MIDYGTVRSTVKPEQIVIDDYSVWEHTGITEVSENVGEENEFIGYEYNMKQYTKDEFILAQSEANTEPEESLTDTQLALCEVYEMLA